MKPSAHSRLHVYQIYYSEDTFQTIDPGFLPLDNMANPRPDWREYWPIRNFLLASDSLDEEAHYGFFSPKFGEKTRLTASSVFEFAEQRKNLPDVIAFSPYFDQIAMFLNVYEQGEAHHPGLMRAAQVFLHTTGLKLDLATLVGHTGSSVYCNYFLAKPRFWREWLRINEALFALCEDGATELATALGAMTTHNDGFSCPLKVFVMERTVSLLLMTGQFRCAAYNPIELPRASSPAARLGDELLIADALKLAYCTTGQPDYLQAFHSVRQAAVQRLAGKP